MLKFDKKPVRSDEPLLLYHVSCDGMVVAVTFDYSRAVEFLLRERRKGRTPWARKAHNYKLEVCDVDTDVQRYGCLTL